MLGDVYTQVIILPYKFKYNTFKVCWTNDDYKIKIIIYSLNTGARFKWEQGTNHTFKVWLQHRGERHWIASLMISSRCFQQILKIVRVSCLKTMSNLNALSENPTCYVATGDCSQMTWFPWNWFRKVWSCKILYLLLYQLLTNGEPVLLCCWHFNGLQAHMQKIHQRGRHLWTITESNFISNSIVLMANQLL